MAAKKKSGSKKKTGAKAPGPRSSRDEVKRLGTAAFDQFVAEKYQVPAGGAKPTKFVSKNAPEHQKTVTHYAKKAAKSILGKSNPNRKFKKAPPKKKKK